MSTENKKAENPQAFPQSWMQNGTTDNWENGMTILDYHVSKLMQVYLAEHLKALSENRSQFTIKDMVESSYIIAEEILKQRRA